MIADKEEKQTISLDFYYKQQVSATCIFTRYHASRFTAAMRYASPTQMLAAKLVKQRLNPAPKQCLGKEVQYK